MVNNKKYSLITAVLVIALICSALYLLFIKFNQSGFDVLINNKTITEISGLNITYNNITKDWNSQHKTSNNL